MRKISMATLLTTAAIAAASVATSAEAAVTVPFTFEAGNFFVGGSGSGSFTTNVDSGTSGLADLSAFSLSGTGSAFFLAGVAYDFDLSDLNSFSTTIANGVVTALSFATDSKQVDLFFGPVPIGQTDLKFTVDGLGADNLTANNSFVGDVTGTLTVASGAVPEPATWAMMVGGLGFAGAALRRRRANVRTTIAFA